VAKPLLEGLVESLDLAAGLGVVGPGVAERDASGGQGELEGDPPAAAWDPGEHRAVVGQHRGRIPVPGGRFQHGGSDVIGLEHRQCPAEQTEPGVVVEDVEDLHLAPAGQSPVGDVGLPAFVGLGRFEPHEAALGSFVRLRGHEPAGGQDPPDRGDRRRLPVALGQVERDGGGAGLVAAAVELLAQRDDQVLHLR